MAPDVLGATLDGTEVQVSRHRGQVVVLSFWAAWCAPCRLELPQLEALQRAAGDRMRVVAINIEGRPEFKRAARALSELQLTVTHDYNKAIQRAYGVTSIPHLVVVGRDGRVRKVLKGYSEKQLDAILAQVNAALQEP
ncbi:TlpA disulfide reductase family protein [Piscinibacter sakaiensis]|uniref:TlpA family protein disulfide reductase n=1 Tax=Piscinibacter sakaiensis TaxID=1547922 RepID=UPI003727C72A